VKRRKTINQSNLVLIDYKIYDLKNKRGRNLEKVGHIATVDIVCLISWILNSKILLRNSNLCRNKNVTNLPSKHYMNIILVLGIMKFLY